MRLDHLYDETRAFVEKAHKGQTDKQGKCYVEHLIAVSEIAKREYLLDTSRESYRHSYEDSIESITKSSNILIIGLLHDIIEDTNYILDDLRCLGYSENIVKGVEGVTHFKKEPYVDYIVRVGKHELAKYVKRGDLIHNSDIRRSMYGKEPRCRTIKRLEKYFASYAFLKGGISEKEYRKTMNFLYSKRNNKK